MISREAIDAFEQLTNFDLRGWMQDFYDFIFDNRQDIINYYSGVTSTPNRESFEALDDMIKRTNELTGVVEGRKNSLKTGAMWDLIDNIASAKTALQTIDNSSRWLRSAISKNNFNPNPEIEHVMHQLQTLEAIASDVFGSSDRDQDWTTIALNNAIKEEDYTTQGGVTIKTQLINGAAVRVESVVDNIQGENIYGKDIDKTFTYEDNDIKVLSPNDTIKQAVQIMAELRRGDNPEYPSLGVQSNLILGVSSGSIAYPALFRHWFATFATDDTLKSFTISGINQKEDFVEFEFKVETRLGEVLDSGTSI